MHSAVAALIDRMEGSKAAGTGIVAWGAPIPTFGDLSTARVATVGLNPSNREFMDLQGHELSGRYRRFHTLRSLGLSSWSDAHAGHLRLILDACRQYFRRNPYESWFKPLNQVIAGTHTSYYDWL